MLRSAVISTFALLALALAAPGVAQPIQSAEDVAVVVQGRTETAMRAFVSQISASPHAENQLGRWTLPLCLSITGVNAAERQAIRQPIIQHAHELGLGVDESGHCHNNVLVLVSDNPDAVARELAARPRDMAVYNNAGRFSLGQAAFARFVASDKPVRWWLVNNLVDRDDQVTAGFGMENNTVGVSHLNGGHYTGGHNSRIHAATHRDFVAAFIIVDARAVRELRYDWAAVGEYVSMVALAQLDPDTDTSSYPTILNLFAHPHEPRAITEWDAAYLRGLYEATRDVTAQRQQGEIASTMVGALRH